MASPDQLLMSSTFRVLDVFGPKTIDELIDITGRGRRDVGRVLRKLEERGCLREFRPAVIDEGIPPMYEAISGSWEYEH